MGKSGTRGCVYDYGKKGSCNGDRQGKMSNGVVDAGSVWAYNSEKGYGSNGGEEEEGAWLLWL